MEWEWKVGERAKSSSIIRLCQYIMSKVNQLIKGKAHIYLYKYGGKYEKTSAKSRK